jgi:hypothetical protein
MSSKVLNPDFLCGGFDNTPDCPVAQPFAQNAPTLRQRAQETTVFNLCCYLPGVNSLLHPNRYRDRSDPAALTLQVDDDPPALTLLNVFELQCGEFSASQRTSDQERQNAVIALAFDRGAVRHRKQFFRAARASASSPSDFLAALDSVIRCCFQNYLAQCFRAIWRSVGAPPQREPDSSRHEYAGDSQAESNIYPYSRSNSRFSRRDACPSTSVVRTQRYPNSSQTLRHIAIKATLQEQYETALQRWGHVLLSQHAGLVGRDIQSALDLRKNAADERDASNKRMEDHKRSCPVCNHNGRPPSLK